MINWVLPGFEEVLASFDRRHSMLIREDLPTLDLPVKAYSGKGPGGHSRMLLLLLTKDTFLMTGDSIAVYLMNISSNVDLPSGRMVRLFRDAGMSTVSPILTVIPGSLAYSKVTLPPTHI